MKIVSLNDFLSMPYGTVFAKYGHAELCVKGDSIEGAADFHYWPLWQADMDDISGDIPVDTHAEQRDGEFDHAQLFAVFSRLEVARMAESLAPLGDGWRFGELGKARAGWLKELEELKFFGVSIEDLTREELLSAIGALAVQNKTAREMADGLCRLVSLSQQWFPCRD